MRCENVANGCECAADGLPKRGERIAKTLRIFGECVANGCECAAYGLPKRGERIATMQHSKNKNHTFVTQKPPFCTSKTILLHVKNHTFARQKPYFCNANM